jgi:LDH2 family malate/lactate/ureidoglycolate dehydrogenase
MGRDESRPHNSPPGTGPAGYYAERIAREGFIGMVFCGSSKMVAPSGSSEPAFGSNPVAIGIPTGSEALVLDMATSAMPIFKVAEVLFKGEMGRDRWLDAFDQSSFGAPLGGLQLLRSAF